MNISDEALTGVPRIELPAIVIDEPEQYRAAGAGE